MQPQKHWVEGSTPTACCPCSDQCSTVCGWPSPHGSTSDSGSTSALWRPLLQICCLPRQCPGCMVAWYFPITSARLCICLWWTSRGFCSWGFLQPIHVPLKDNPVLQHTDCFSHLGVICKLAEGVFHPIIHVTNEHVKQFWPQYQSPGNIVHNDTNCTTNSLSPVFHPSYSLPMWNKP